MCFGRFFGPFRSCVYNTKQIKAERQVAKESGKQFEIVTGEKTHVSKKISEDEIVRRKDIGPK